MYFQMKIIISFTYKVIRKILYFFISIIEKSLTLFLFYINDVNFTKFKTIGIPFVSVRKGGCLFLGKNFRMNNGIRGNPIGRSQRCIFIVNPLAILTVGSNVGMSQTAIVCSEGITIEDNVKIGGGVCIYDTDFHSLKSYDRINPKEDFINTKTSPIKIKKSVFIGAHSTILKGVTIGENSIVGAGSVVTKNIPPGEIWGGNPAKFIRVI